MLWRTDFCRGTPNLESKTEIAEKQSDIETLYRIGKESRKMTEKEKMCRQMLYDANYDKDLQQD